MNKKSVKENLAKILHFLGIMSDKKPDKTSKEMPKRQVKKKV